MCAHAKKSSHTQEPGAPALSSGSRWFCALSLPHPCPHSPLQPFLLHGGPGGPLAQQRVAFSCLGALTTNGRVPSGGCSPNRGAGGGPRCMCRMVSVPSSAWCILLPRVTTQGARCSQRLSSPHCSPSPSAWTICIVCQHAVGEGFRGLSPQMPCVCDTSQEMTQVTE